MDGLIRGYNGLETAHRSENKQGIQNLSGRLVYIYVIAVSIFFLAFFLQSREQNWDMLGYAASTLSSEELSTTEIHSSVYSSLKEYASPEDYQRLTSEGIYEVTMHNDPDAFMQQIPYYKIRIVYVGMMKLLSELDINIYYAGNLISAFAGALGFLVFSLIFLQYVRPAFIVLAPLLLVLSGVQDTAQRVGPDTLLFLWFGLIFWAFIKNHWLIYPLLILSVWIRTDAILLVALFLTYLLYIDKRNLKPALITGLLSGIGLIGVNTWAGNHGWSTVFHYVFVTDMLATHPDEFSSYGVTFSEYINAVKQGLKSLTYNYRFIGFLSNSIIVAFVIWNIRAPDKSLTAAISQALKNPVFVLILLSSAYVALHFLLFPAMWSRFFLAQYMTAGFGVFYVITILLDSGEKAFTTQKT